ncbi:mitofusin [Ceratobasidium sp. UAMH 11750]|nr:mitofusin [Ceratobasidium sp. UAMH 11750]
MPTPAAAHFTSSWLFHSRIRARPRWPARPRSPTGPRPHPCMPIHPCKHPQHAIQRPGHSKHSANAGKEINVLRDFRELICREQVTQYPQLAKPDCPGPVEGLVADDFHVPRLDLSLGPNGVHNPLALVSNLEKASIAHLLNNRIKAALTHANKLKVRIADTRSKVLVTGDLNTGKSMLVNALLHHDVLPIDQQPFTSVFCEAHDVLENDNVEEVHVIPLDKVA